MVESKGASGPAGMEKIVKYTAMIVSILTLVVGVITFFVQQSNLAETRERESRAAFLAKQLEIYSVAVQTVSEIVLYPTKDDDEEKYLRNLKKFWQLYYGRMTMVEDLRVAKVMIAIGNLLQKEGGKPDRECVSIKRNLSLILADCVRKSLSEGWGINFGSNKNDHCSEERLDRLPKNCRPSAGGVD